MTMKEVSERYNVPVKILKEKEEFNKKNVFGLGQENTAFAQYFIGSSYLNPLTDSKETAVFLANVTFEPGCRNNWHIHHAKSGGGQLLICTAGSGWYQEEGKEAVSLEPGMGTGCGTVSMTKGTGFPRQAYELGKSL